MTRTGRGFTAAAVGAALLTASSGTALAAPADPLAGRSAQKAAAHVPSKVAWAVRDLAADVLRGTTRGNALLRVDRAQRIEVAIHGAAPVSAAQEGQLRALGARLTAQLPRGIVPRAGVVQAMVPASALAAIEAMPWTVAITPPGGNETDSHPLNGFVSEGVALHSADDVQTRGENGAGVSVGVVSDGVSNLAASQAQNELPAVTVIDAGSGDEGTAMLEIVHDMAPGADLLFNQRGSGTADHVTRLQDLVAAGADVITEDIPFDAEPAFQYGLVAQASDAIAASGVPMHSSAGNQAARHAERVLANGTGSGPDGTSFGSTPAGCTNTPDNVVAIAPAGDTTFDVQLGNNASFTLQWSEPRAIFPTPGRGGFTDLNLYVMNASLTQCLGESVAVQANGIGDTIEQLAIGGLGGLNAKIVVDVEGTSSAVTPPRIDLRWRGATASDTPTRAGSMNPDATYLGLATTSAAVDAINGGLEPFSSGGPVDLIQTTTCPGNAPGPCVGVAGSSAGTSAGPTWTAADNVTVSGVGGFGNALPGGGAAFTGTSAAAPHAAACDALLRSETGQPNAAPAVTTARLLATATDMGTPGTDASWGGGQLDCLQAVNDPPTVSAGGPYSTDEGVDVGLTATGEDPDAGDTLSYEWDFDEDNQFDDATGPNVAFDRVGQDDDVQARVRVTDTADAVDEAAAAVTVVNVPPTTVLGGTAPIVEGDTVQLTGSVTDPGWLEPLTATIDWGDGLGPQAVSGVLENLRADATLELEPEHAYGDDGEFVATACGFDDDVSHCTDTAVTVLNAAPDATIDLTGAQDIGGVPTILATAGATVPFNARTTDAGSDDLTLTWSWDDGDPVPDVTTTSLVNPPATDGDPSPTVQPRDVLDEQPHAFAEACAYEVGFAAADDDGATAADTVRVLIVGTATKRQSSGWWHHQALRSGATRRTVAEVLCRLAIAAELSTVFDEARAVSTLQQAEAALQPEQNGRPDRQLDRELLTAWLNVADGSLPYATAAAVLAEAEAVRLDPAATTAALGEQRAKVHALRSA